MTSPAIRVALLGCGRIAQLAHLNVLRRLQGVEIAALADADPARLSAARAYAPRARLFAHYIDAIDCADAAVIALPPGLHADAAITAFRAGRHVYVEKPLATDLASGVAIAEAWRAAGTIGRIGFNYRYHPLHVAARDHIRAGRLGPVVAIRSVFSSAQREQPAWKRLRGSGGGALLDLGSHHIDLFRFLLDDEIALVSALLQSREHEEDSSYVHVQLAGGVTAQSLFSISGIATDRWEFMGRHGLLILDRHNAGLAFEPSYRRGGAARRVWREANAALRGLGRIAGGRGEPSYRASLADFIACVRDGRASGPDIEDGLRAHAVIDAAERSAAAGGRLIAPVGIESAVSPRR